MIFVYAGTDNPAASASVSKIELSHDGFLAYNKFAESEPSVSFPQTGNLAYISFLVLPSFSSDRICLCFRSFVVFIQCYDLLNCNCIETMFLNNYLLS